MLETATLLIGFAAVHLMVVISPGPSFLVVARAAVAASRRYGAWIAVGLGLGSVIWAMAALFGLTLLFRQVPWLYAGMKVAGALYLIFLGVMLWRHARDPLTAAASPGHSRSHNPGRGAGRGIRLGILTQLSNPKAAVFFGSVFVTLLPADPTPATVALVLAVIFVNECVWYMAVARAFSIRRLRDAYLRVKAWSDRVTGAFLSALGVRLMTDA